MPGLAVRVVLVIVFKPVYDEKYLCRLGSAMLMKAVKNLYLIIIKSVNESGANSDTIGLNSRSHHKYEFDDSNEQRASFKGSISFAPWINTVTLSGSMSRSPYNHINGS